MDRTFLESLPMINAGLNATSGILLFLGYRFIKKRNPVRHKQMMLAALSVSALFLISYLGYHYAVGSVRYPIHDWTRMLYLAILIPHSILAGLMVPFIVSAVYFALKGKFARHTAITRWLWPVWMFVSVTGVFVYLLLYQYAGAKPS